MPAAKKLSPRQQRKADKAKRKTEVDRYQMKTSDKAGGINLNGQSNSGGQSPAIGTSSGPI
jgi:hypothetical protein